MAIISLTDVKMLLSLPDDSKDALIELLIPEVEGDYLRIRGAAFEINDAGATVYPDGSKLTAARMISFLMANNPGVAAEKIGNYSFTAEEASSGYPKSVTSSIKRVMDLK